MPYWFIILKTPTIESIIYTVIKQPADHLAKTRRFHTICDVIETFKIDFCSICKISVSFETSNGWLCGMC